MAHYVEVYMQFCFCFKVWMKQNFIDMKDFNCNYTPIYPTFFNWLLQFLPLAAIKIYEQQELTKFYIFIFASKPSSVSLQSHPQNTSCASFQVK